MARVGAGSNLAVEATAPHVDCDGLVVLALLFLTLLPLAPLPIITPAVQHKTSAIDSSFTHTLQTCLWHRCIPSSQGYPSLWPSECRAPQPIRLCRTDHSRQGELKKLGVTAPISVDSPKPDDLKSSEGECTSASTHRTYLIAALMGDLIQLNQFESEQERKVR